MRSGGNEREREREQASRLVVTPPSSLQLLLRVMNHEIKTNKNSVIPAYIPYYTVLIAASTVLWIPLYDIIAFEIDFYYLFPHYVHLVITIVNLLFITYSIQLIK